MWVLTSYTGVVRCGRTGRERWDGWGRQITTDESRWQTETDSPLYMWKKSITIDRLAWCRKCVCVLLLRTRAGQSRAKSMRACVSICVVRRRKKIAQRGRGTERSLFCGVGAKIDKELFGFCMIM